MMIIKNLKIILMLSCLASVAFAEDEHTDTAYDEAYDQCYEMAENQSKEYDWQDVFENCMKSKGFAEASTE